ncbi:MAG TPA: hypothetical protein VGB17_07510 [Pyrinomonadaceae bacterium]|jgi:hypothetical protein
MSDENRLEERQGNESSLAQTSAKGAGGGLNDAGDPGSTPGTAEGERETVEQDIEDKEKKGEL